MISPPLHCRFAALPALRLQSTTPKISVKSVNALKTMGLPWKQSEVKAVTALTSTLPHCQPCVFNRGLLKFVSKFEMCRKEEWAYDGNQMKSRRHCLSTNVLDF